jgi:hypothetical protein
LHFFGFVGGGGGGGGAVIVSGRVTVVVFPSVSAWVTVTVYVPAAVNPWVTDAPVAAPPSPTTEERPQALTTRRSGAYFASVPKTKLKKKKQCGAAQSPTVQVQGGQRAGARAARRDVRADATQKVKTIPTSLTIKFTSRGR